MDKPVHVYKTYIRATVEEVWNAIIDPEQTAQYFYGTLVESDWEVGSSMNYYYPDGRQASEGQVLSIDAPKRMEFTFHALWDEELKAEGPAREVWALAEINGMVELKVEIYEIGEKTLENFKEGLPYIISGLKSLVETGEALPPPGP